MTDDEKLSYDLTECRLLCAVCITCATRPDFHYEPGSTRTVCKCGNFDTLPDWQPRRAMRIWNACVMTKNNSRKNIEFQKNRIK